MAYVMNMQDDPPDPEDDSLSDMLDGAPSTSPHLPVDGQQKQRVVVLTGAGISAESGLRTFRGSDGLWEGHRVEEVATPAAWEADPARVLRFYNDRRKQARSAKPNAAHKALSALQRCFEVDIITQNVDDLHERAGSARVLHLHGEVMKARSTRNYDYLIELGSNDISLGDTCPAGSQLRPHVVWFGEEVPAMTAAAELVAQADILLCVGTSLQVYPAASLAFLAPDEARRIVVDPHIPESIVRTTFECIAKPASEGVPSIVRELVRDSGSQSDDHGD
jgi:NAD-dependent deacetylase